MAKRRLPTRIFYFLFTVYVCAISLWTFGRGAIPTVKGWFSNRPVQDYDLSIHTMDGRRLSKQAGPLKLLIDPFVVYRNAPSQKTASYSIDNRGFRHTPANVSAGASDLAIVVGGSSSFGHSVKDDAAIFPAVINKTSQQYSAVNASVVGYLSGQELALMVNYLDRLKPKLYIVFDGINEVFDPFFYYRKWPQKPAPIGFNNTFFIIQDRLATACQKEDFRCDKEPIPGVSAPVPENEDQLLETIVNNYTANLEKMHAFATARGAKFLVVFQPELTRKKTITPAEQKALDPWNEHFHYSKNKIPERYATLVSRAKAFCEKRNIAYLDINTESDFVDSKEAAFSDPNHPNANGHKLIGQIIAKRIDSL
jgi:lysophospholipase L1-like esterase